MVEMNQRWAPYLSPPDAINGKSHPIVIDPSIATITASISATTRILPDVNHPTRYIRPLRHHLWLHRHAVWHLTHHPNL
ncbi:hypothetical protein U1Q18_005475 [Sarracenia purpurea var. burkii]